MPFGEERTARDKRTFPRALPPSLTSAAVEIWIFQINEKIAMVVRSFRA